MVIDVLKYTRTHWCITKHTAYSLARMVIKSIADSPQNPGELVFSFAGIDVMSNEFINSLFGTLKVLMGNIFVKRVAIIDASDNDMMRISAILSI